MYLYSRYFARRDTRSAFVSVTMQAVTVRVQCASTWDCSAAFAFLPSLRTVTCRFQFERQGFFCVDPDSQGGKLVCNRTCTLNESKDK